MTIKDLITAAAQRVAGLALGALMLGVSLAPLAAAAKAPGPVKAPPATEARAASDVKPLMWVIKDADSTIYLFGSIHVMKADVKWLTPAIRARFESADDLWLEVPNIDDTMAVLQTAQTYTLNPANDMTKGLTDAEVKTIDEDLAPYGLSASKMMGVKKWAVGLFLVTQKMSTLGYNPKIGVDLTLMDGARYFGKPVHGLETLDRQMQYLAPTTDADDIAALRESLGEIDDAPTYLAGVLQAWKTGDEPAMTHLLIDKMKADDQAGYQRVVVARNADWEPQIETLLKGKGTTFIAVGTAHLIGPDSLIAMLKRHGITAVPVK